MSMPDENVISAQNAEKPDESAPDPVPAVAIPAAANGSQAIAAEAVTPSAEVPTATPGGTVITPRNGETLVQSLLSIIVIVLFVITFVVQAFQIPSESMEKTLLIGDYLLVDKVHFGQGGLSSWLLPYRPLQRGDVIVFHYPVDPSQHFVKRVVGTPGDHLRLRNKTVLLNDAPLPEDYAIHVRGDHEPYRDNFPSEKDQSGQVESQWRIDLPRYLQNGDLVVPDGQYFVMGDNRDHSLDSRYWGFVPRENIVGRPLVIYLSVRNHPEDAAGAGNDRLYNSGRLLSHVWQFARWNRMFHLVR